MQESYLRWVEVLAAIGVLVSSLEFLAAPQLLDDASFMSWPVFRLRLPLFSEGVSGRILGSLLQHKRLRYIQASQMLAAIVLILWPGPQPLHVLLLAMIAFGLMAMMLRTTFGLEGSDQMALILFVTLLLVQLNPTRTAMTLGLWFIGLQACLAYFTAGAYKVVSESWRDGTALAGVLGTHAYGNARLARWLSKHMGITKWLSRAFSISEAAFPIVLAAPRAALPYLLLGGIGFHALCAVIMGLNVFFWSFVATYPAIYYCATHLDLTTL